MRYCKTAYGFVAASLCAGLLLFCVNVNADTGSQGNDARQDQEGLPHYEKTGSFYLGFRLVDVDAMSRVAEYEDDESSLTFGVDGLACPLPHRYHAHADYLSENSYYGDIGYAYRDLVLFRDLFVGVHHNLDHYHYLYPSTTAAFAYEDRSVLDENYIDFYKNELLLRVKSPDYPFHVFFRDRYISREGEIEERFLGGGIGNLVKVSETRAVDWDSNSITLGMNSHLGPVEIEYAYDNTEFDPGPNNVLYDYYPASSIFGRPADSYPHSVVPETESMSNSIKFHSSYTGQIVLGATFSNGKNTNNYSGTEAETWKAALDLRWIPDPTLSFFLKYRHNELDKDNPAEVVVNGQVFSNAYTVRSLVSTRTDLFSLSARYRALTKLTLIGNYELELRRRSDVDEWEVLPEDSDVHRVKLTAHARPLSDLKLKAVYDYNTYDNPSYNTEPDHMNKLRLNATYTPLTWLTALMDYSITDTRRDELRYFSGTTRQLHEQGERDGRRDHFLGSLAFTLSPKATLTTSWNYNRWKVEQDLAYASMNSGGTPYFDNGIPYEDESHTWALSLYYRLRKDMALSADLTYTIAEGEFLPQVPLEDGSTSLGSFSDIDREETAISAELAKKILNDWEVGLRMRFGYYDDELSDIGSDHQDGKLYTTTLTLKRYF